jgi:eukaryotic-like serine/threonine-protein kinase
VETRDSGASGSSAGAADRTAGLGREVALKVLAQGGTAEPTLLERFTREARAVASLNHPNIVTLHSIEQHDDVHFLTMELVNGKPLNDLITPGGLPWPMFFEIAIAVTDALSAVHEKGVVHRDLKPSNIMASDAGAVKVLDLDSLRSPRGMTRRRIGPAWHSRVKAWSLVRFRTCPPSR